MAEIGRLQENRGNIIKRKSPGKKRGFLFYCLFEFYKKQARETFWHLFTVLEVYQNFGEVYQGKHQKRLKQVQDVPGNGCRDTPDEPPRGR